VRIFKFCVIPLVKRYLKLDQGCII